VAIELSDGWNAELDRGPDWLFVRLSGTDSRGGAADLSGAIWKLLEQSMAHRLVLELEGLSILPSHVIGELVRLHKRIHAQGGLMRLSGLSEQCQEVLRINRLDDRFPHYHSRHEAVMGCRPVQPR
jgi:anti-anti-sigma factor